jgi:hypothetical protein
MEKTPSGTSVGVDDPYVFAGRCDFVTDDGRCRFAIEHAASDPEFARERRREGYACPVVETDRSPSAGGTGGRTDSDEANRSDGAERNDGDAYGGDEHGGEAGRVGRDRYEEPWAWRECPQYRSRTRGRRCVRCGLEERRAGSSNERLLLDEHHLSYPGRSSADAADEPSHEISVSLCRWCHAKVHGSWARVNDEASPDPEAIAAREGRRSRERAETAFETAAERRDERSSER